MILKNINGKIYKNNQTLFAVDVKKQKQILRTLPEPKDIYERSYFQYKCQMKKQSVLFVIVQNILALILLPIYYIKLSIARKDVKQETRENCAVFFTDGISIQTMPECLHAEYNEIIPCTFAEELHIGKQEKTALSIIFVRYWYSPYFVFKCMLKIGMYAAKIKKFNPRSIISYSEYSYTSSVLTEYCRLCGVEHINIMHGEKLFNIRDTFVQYDRYYVWDEHYIKLLTDLRADKKQFHIAVPNNVKLDCTNNGEPIYDYTYYLGEETTEELLTIRDALLRTGVPSSRICIRYHPRYCDANEIKHIYMDFQVQNPIEVALSISFYNTRYVVSLYSTVLYQAYESGKKIIIDDVTNKVKYEQLKELRYVMLEKPHLKFSDHLYRREQQKCEF